MRKFDGHMSQTSHHAAKAVVDVAAKKMRNGSWGCVDRTGFQTDALSGSLAWHCDVRVALTNK
jgi:hypothetical protein